jgi:ABC-type lipoprotein export system ATPase subunit
MINQEIFDRPLARIVEEIPMSADFFKVYGIDCQRNRHSLTEILDDINDDFWDTHSITRHRFLNVFVEFMQGMEQVVESQKINSLEVLPGIDKDRQRESCSLIMKPGEITCIVGPTGSGKSRLLADIEWFANNDTPTKRVIKINGKIPDEEMKNSFGGKLIAQITQNMNFVLDMDVEGFLILHAQSRFLDNAKDKVEEVIELANKLSGEQFSPKTPVTFLSGGQSRALMIADVACIGQAPVVLIDEIENAGVDKKLALELLVNQDKIVIMATHDPLLILQAQKRVVIKNGGMQKIIVTNHLEKSFYTELEKIDASMQMARNFFRSGNELQNKRIFDMFAD